MSNFIGAFSVFGFRHLEASQNVEVRELARGAAISLYTLKIDKSQPAAPFQTPDWNQSRSIPQNRESGENEPYEPRVALRHLFHERLQRIMESCRDSGCSGLHCDETSIVPRLRIELLTSVEEHFRQHLNL